MLACFGIWFINGCGTVRKTAAQNSAGYFINPFIGVGLVLLFAAAPNLTIGIEGLRVVINTCCGSLW